MDAMSSNKRVKSNRKRSISDLPDAILRRILHFLPTKEAVKTSVLSRRWEYLWTSIPNLEFIEDSETESDNFMPFVDRAISLDISDIKKFTLECYTAGDEPCIKRLIAAAVRRNVEELQINTSDSRSKEPLQLPKCLFVSASLTRLDLTIACTLKFPPSICLPSLKHLRLEYIKFSDDDSTQQFFSGCPALETICFYYCKWTNLSSVGLCAPKLWKLEIIEDQNEMGDYHEASDGCEVMIFAPYLHYFDFIGEFLDDYCIYDSPPLNEANIHFTDGSIEYEIELPRIAFYRFYKLLKGISNVKQLLLSGDTVQNLNFAADLLPYMPGFNNLSTLSFNWEIIELDCEALIKMLQCSPRLESLCFKNGIKLSSHRENDKWLSESVAPGILSRLKTVEIYVRGFDRNKKLFVDAMERLLERAAALDKLTVYVSRYYTATMVGGYKERLKKELLELPKASKVCRVFVFSS